MQEYGMILRKVKWEHDMPIRYLAYRELQDPKKWSGSKEIFVRKMSNS
jgi:hypothetical protein